MPRVKVQHWQNGITFYTLQRNFLYPSKELYIKKVFYILTLLVAIIALVLLTLIHDDPYLTVD